MVRIRMSRAGTNKRPFYHIVVADKRERRDRRIERLGHFNPIATGQEVRLTFNKERMEYWLSQGAQPSERVTYLYHQYTAGN